MLTNDTLKNLTLRLTAMAAESEVSRPPVCVSYETAEMILKAITGGIASL